MPTLVFLLEEPSAREMLKGFLPKILPPEVVVRYLVYEGKQDLEKRMGRALQTWQVPDSCFVVLRDQDSGDCRKIKADLRTRCEAANRPNAVVRIACRELEAWFIGDWTAVSMAFGKPELVKLQDKALYRQPDSNGSPAAELRKHIPTYKKVDGARCIGPYLESSRSHSRSFQVFVDGVVRLVTGD